MGSTQIQSSPAVRVGGARVQLGKRDPLRGLLWTGIALILFTVGRVVDIVPFLKSLPLVKIAMLCGVIALVAQYKFLPKVVTTGNGSIKLALILAAWVVISFAFSIWLGPSRDFILVRLPVFVIVVTVILKLSESWTSLRNLYLALVVSGLILSVSALLSFNGGRLDVRASTDPNDLAYVLVGIIPTALAFAMTELVKTRRLFFYGSIAVMTLAVLLTGSRGGMIALFIVGAAIALESGRPQLHQPTRGRGVAPKKGMGVKARIFLSLFACVVVGAAAWPQLPQETRERLTSMLDLGSDYNLSSNPEDLGRVQIWTRGMGALAHRPIGFGIGAYSMVDYRYGGRFYTAHNSFVLVAVELGLVGIALYLAILTKVWRGLTRSREVLGKVAEPTELQRQLAVFCRMAQVSLAGNLIAGFFLSAAYFYAHWVNIALAMAMIALISRENIEPPLERKRAFRR